LAELAAEWTLDKLLDRMGARRATRFSRHVAPPTKKLAGFGTRPQFTHLQIKTSYVPSWFTTKRGFLPAIQYLHIFDLDQSSPMDWLELLPSLKTLAVYTPIVCVHEGWQSDHQIYQDANKFRFGCQQYEHNAGERDIFRLERNFALSVLFRTFTYVERVWHLDVWLPLSHVFLDAQEVLMSLQICHVNLDMQSPGASAV
jgi:hypothetical protein